MSRKPQQAFSIAYAPKEREFYLLASAPCGCEKGYIKISISRLRKTLCDFDKTRMQDLGEQNS